MNRLVSTSVLGVVSLLCFSSTRLIIEAANFSASKVLNVSQVNESELHKPHHRNINTTTATGQVISSTHCQHSHDRHHKTSKNYSMIHSDRNSTLPKLLLPSTTHRPNETKQVQLETATFIAAEKGVPYKEGNLISSGGTIVDIKSRGNQLNITQSEHEIESSKIVSNYSANLKEISNGSVGDKEVTSWTKSPLLHNAFQYLVTEFYPDKILNSLTKLGSSSDQSKVNPSVMYPLLMEGMSVLMNRFTGNDSHESPSKTAQGAIKGKIANVMVNSIDKLFQSKERVRSPSEDPKSTPRMENTTSIGGMVNFDTVKSLLPLIQKVQNNGDISEIVSKYLNSSSSGLKDFDLNKILKKYGSQIGGISKNVRILNAIAKQNSNRSDALNLTSIMLQFMPKHLGNAEDGISPKNSLLRSEFASKVLSKSPVAHLGALDDNIKKFLTSSLERAISRVKIDQNGQIQMSEGMKKMIDKMLQDSESNGTATSTMDSINEVLKTVAQMSSVPVNITAETPKSTRNVTKHSHLHRKFQEKYGKDPRVLNSSPSISCSSVAMLLVTVAACSLQA